MSDYPKEYDNVKVYKMRKSITGTKMVKCKVMLDGKTFRVSFKKIPDGWCPGVVTLDNGLIVGGHDKKKKIYSECKKALKKDGYDVDWKS